MCAEWESNPDRSARLDLANSAMLAESAEYFAEDFSLTKLNLGKPYDPTYMHPDSIAALGLESGDLMAVTSPHDHHAFGPSPAYRAKGTSQYASHCVRLLERCQYDRCR